MIVIRQVTKAVRYIEIESEIVVTKGWDGEENGELSFNGFSFSKE